MHEYDNYDILDVDDIDDIDYQSDKGDDDLEDLIYYVVKLNIILNIFFNAQKRGWTVQVLDNQIILTKKHDDLTRLDTNTPRLIESLIN